MSHTSPSGDEHYRLYEIPAHPYIPPFVSDPERELRNKGICGGMEAEMQERMESQREKRVCQPFKTIKVWMRFTKSSTAKQGPNVAVKGRLSESRPNQKQTHYDNKPNHTHRKVDTLHIKARQGGEESLW